MMLKRLKWNVHWSVIFRVFVVEIKKVVLIPLKSYILSISVEECLPIKMERQFGCKANSGEIKV